MELGLSLPFGVLLLERVFFVGRRFLFVRRRRRSHKVLDVLGLGSRPFILTKGFDCKSRCDVHLPIRPRRHCRLPHDVCGRRRLLSAGDGFSAHDVGCRLARKKSENLERTHLREIVAEGNAKNLAEANAEARARKVPKAAKCLLRKMSAAG